MTLHELRAKGFTQNPDGSWSKSGNTLDRVEASKPKLHQRSEVENKELVQRQEGVAFCITIIVFGRKLMDKHDNLKSSVKPIVDSITAELGFRSDDDPLLHWQYGQVATDAETGCLVTIETIEGNRD